RHHAHRAGAAGLHGTLGGAGATAADAPDQVPRVFAPHSKLRAAVTPAHRGVGAPQLPAATADPAKPPTPRHVAVNSARRLKRVFGIEIEGCARCGGKLKVIASIEEPEVITKILTYLERMAPEHYQSELPLGARAPPRQASLI